MRPSLQKTLLVSSAALIAILIAAAAQDPERVRRKIRYEGYRMVKRLSGKLVDIGGQRIHIECAGTGSPTVILESGLGKDVATWERVQPAVAHFTRVCAYDRVAVGLSDYFVSPGKRTSEDAVKELESLIRAAEIAAPYVLVGHSFGAFIIRLYAHRHPSEVAGLVIVDGSHEEQFETYSAALGPEQRQSYMQTETGDNRERMNTIASGRLAAAARPLPDVPIRVLTAAQSRYPELHREIQRRMLSSLPGALQTVVYDSGHYIQRDQPDAVIDAIREITAAQPARTSR
jgi:pimeloyl-ACP methyl ester carboxylesterase